MNFLKIRELSDQELESLYENHFVNDFPRDEQKPLQMILDLKHGDKYLCFGLFENNVMRGYAIVGKDGKSKNLLLDYFAILKPYRSDGYGAKFLKLLSGALNEYDGLILEVESLEHAANEEERVQRERRLSFYYANGIKKTNIVASMNKVVYTVLYYPYVTKWQEEKLVEDINSIYRVLYIGDYYDKCFDYVRII